jgi:hypothetical protein
MPNTKRIESTDTIGLPASAADPRFRAFFAYWQSVAPVGRLPGRQHIDPLTIPREVLPNIALYDIVPAETDFRVRVRLLGTAVVELLGVDHTGLFIDETMPADAYRPLHESFRLVAQGQPQYWQRTLPYPNRNFTGIKRLALPLATDGHDVDMTINCYLPVLQALGTDSETGF